MAYIIVDAQTYNLNSVRHLRTAIKLADLHTNHESFGFGNASSRFTYDSVSDAERALRKAYESFDQEDGARLTPAYCLSYDAATAYIID